MRLILGRVAGERALVGKTGCRPGVVRLGLTVVAVVAVEDSEVEEVIIPVPDVADVTLAAVEDGNLAVDEDAVDVGEAVLVVVVVCDSLGVDFVVLLTIADAEDKVEMLVDSL